MINYSEAFIYGWRFVMRLDEETLKANESLPFHIIAGCIQLGVQVECTIIMCISQAVIPLRHKFALAIIGT